MNFKIFQIPSVYTIWDGLSLKTISRYCPFKRLHEFEETHIRLSEFEEIKISRQSCTVDVTVNSKEESFENVCLDFVQELGVWSIRQRTYVHDVDRICTIQKNIHRLPSKLQRFLNLRYWSTGGGT